MPIRSVEYFCISYCELEAAFGNIPELPQIPEPAHSKNLADKESVTAVDIIRFHAKFFATDNDFIHESSVRQIFHQNSHCRTKDISSGELLTFRVDTLNPPQCFWIFNRSLGYLERNSTVYNFGILLLVYFMVFVASIVIALFYPMLLIFPVIFLLLVSMVIAQYV